jgi:hypothetical protein
MLLLGRAIDYHTVLDDFVANSGVKVQFGSVQGHILLNPELNFWFSSSSCLNPEPKPRFWFGSSSNWFEPIFFFQVQNNRNSKSKKA